MGRRRAVEKTRFYANAKRTVFGQAKPATLITLASASSQVIESANVATV
jgi:hypothetical protein